MGKTTGFLEHRRAFPDKRPVHERINDFSEIERLFDERTLEIQASRCMECGVPFCHSFGCPLNNRIPDFNDLLYRKKWQKACELLHETNNFPEITGRICPAPCETACTLAVNGEAVTIRQIELGLVEQGWKSGWIRPLLAPFKTGRKIAVIGSGPAGLAVAQQLVRAGHTVVVYERDSKPGGLLRFGIPDFKLEKWILDRRLRQLKAEGVTFETTVCAGSDLSVKYLKRSFDAIVLAAGSTTPRDLRVPGRDLQNVHFAMDLLTQQNHLIDNEAIPLNTIISAKGKNVAIIGGGDTGADCVGTCRRQGAKEIFQLEILPQPPAERPESNPWPQWPQTMRTGTSHEEGCKRFWAVNIKEFLEKNNTLSGLRAVAVEWGLSQEGKPPSFKEKPGSEFTLNVDMAVLAMGFIHVEHGPLVKDLDLATDSRGNIVLDKNSMTSHPGVFAAGDCVSGASLVVRAVVDGRKTAAMVDAYVKKL
ncbi:MAG: glutamate synthase [Candidatus Raymondbacteria bacterium RifOxyA12_full_50_37]|uniref:Glutamate synthase n=1 Tax=Candidatus Raymondbacteria bacterium RIFOXYD12_FULL_49_13 TaxID=1817890 RepID=A0A1F7F854_UNCRA|nr:MAG: glutamate synthase [Candidatus Raymondbacteria bacterium RifOxyA12_full_50_37]OGJ86752.1 MAG: glutamate synthase [Candidatus Raymondbacteria bacterium RIFOXYA2_FULL_49_16]OGK02845.1 MAG: glutamate synthase [Candidatus Raymondbacteria bacterium RIFOXYD12_FULL_49_13]OGP40929.1 MAG: glutamate synthase [Candidatus Raymondbacteria bacterium RIFOXYB2_FULL_49_35]